MEAGAVECQSLLQQNLTSEQSNQRREQHEENESSKMMTTLNQITLSSSPDSTKQMEQEMRSAIKKRNVESVKLLLAKGVDVNLLYDETSGDQLLHETVSELSGDPELVKCLINAGASVEAGNKFGDTPIHCAAGYANLDTLGILLDHDKERTLVKLRNNEGKTPLDVAIDYKSIAEMSSRHDCIKLLLKYGSDLGAVDSEGKTALMRIMQMPKGKKILREALDDCITVNEDQLKIDYSLLLTQEPKNINNANLIQMQLLNELIEDVSMERTAHLIQHPVVESFLYLKWLKIRFFFLLSVIFYLVLMIGVTIYTLLVFSNNSVSSANSTVASKSEITQNVFSASKEKIFSTNFIIDANLQLSLIVVIVAILVQEAIQMLSYPLQYLRQTETMIKLVILVSSSILIAMEMPWPIWVDHLAVFTFIFGWTEITLLLSRFPLFGGYGLMFKLVTKQLIKFVFVFFFFLLGFALSFHIMFQGSSFNKEGSNNSDAFSTPWSSLLRTLSMMVGDTIDFETYLMGKDSEAPFKFYGTVHVVYFCFLILVPMILMNLIIGMAVSDIQALQDEGRVKQLRKQNTFIVDMEEAVFRISRMFYHTDWLIEKICLLPMCNATFTLDLKNDNADASLPSGCLDRALAIALEANNFTNKITLATIYNLLTKIEPAINKIMAIETSINTRINCLERILLEKNRP